MSGPSHSPDAGKKDAAAGQTPAGPRLLGRILGWLFGSKVRLAALVSVLILAGSVASWKMTRVEPPTIVELLTEALAELDERNDVPAREKAKNIAQELSHRNDRDLEFPGAAEFILGMVEFRDAEEADESIRDRLFTKAIHSLKGAETYGLRADRRGEWARALGTSLYRTGSATAARPILEEAADTAPYGRPDVMSLLIDIYLDIRQPQELDEALRLGKELTQSELTETARDRAWLQLAQVHMARNEPGDAEAALKNVSQRAWTLGTRVFNAQTRMARREFRQALQDLERVAADAGRDRTFPRQASYLMGVCAENEGDTDAAISYFERTATRYDRSHEAVASLARAARLLQSVGRNEEAVTAYRGALRTVRNTDDFRNRWLTLDDFRRIVVEGWTTWTEARKYDEAIQLARLMPPLIAEPESRELEARSRQQWAEWIDLQMGKESLTAREAFRDESRKRWQDAGAAWAAVAALQKVAINYPDILWASAEAFRRGQALKRSLEQLDAFLATDPKRLQPMALVRRGELLLDLDRAGEAREHFSRVSRDFPNDPAVFIARLRLGDCAVELGKLDEAEKAWRNVLESPELTPDAEQWRLALFSLGRVLCHQADQIAASAPRAGDAAAAETAAPKSALSDAWPKWDESALKLDEYVRRFPTSAESVEARYLLARGLQRSAGQYLTQLGQAETENARQELQSAMDGRLEHANRHLQQLRTELLENSEAAPLGDFHARILASASFEVGHTFFALKKYEQAIVAYNGAINRFPVDPAVFLACLQLAECYERTGRPFDARSMVQQARIILSSSEDSAFATDKTSLNRDEWSQWIDWAGQVRKNAGSKQP